VFSKLKDEILLIWPRIPNNEEKEVLPEVEFATRRVLKYRKSERDGRSIHLTQPF